MKNIYSELGEQRLNQIVSEFYDRVFQSPIISHLFKNDRSEIQRKQVLFLTQFLGGPARYSEEFGHPRMRMRHLPHKITEEAKDEWLRCMKEAINKVLEDDAQLAEELWLHFPKLAQHMVNS